MVRYIQKFGLEFYLLCRPILRDSIPDQILKNICCNLYINKKLIINSFRLNVDAYHITLGCAAKHPFLNHRYHTAEAYFLSAMRYLKLLPLIYNQNKNNEKIFFLKVFPLWHAIFLFELAAMGNIDRL